MRDVVVKDTMEVFAKDLKSNGKLYYLGVTNSANITQSIEQTPIYGGIGGKRFTTISSNKDIAIEVTTTGYNSDIFEQQMGATFRQEEAITLLKTESVKAEKSGEDVVVKIKGVPVGEVTVQDNYGDVIEGTFTTGEVAIADGKEGAFYTAIYEEAEATANILDIDATAMPSTYELQCHGIAFDKDTQEIVADVYWKFNQVRPDGNLQANYALSENQSTVITYNAEAPANSNSYGMYVECRREG